jgi:hypothetical protein
MNSAVFSKLLFDVLRVVNNWNREASCIGKVAYMSIVPATRQAYVLSERRRSLYEPYRCRYCGDYHVGSAQSDPLSICFER